MLGRLGSLLLGSRRKSTRGRLIGQTRPRPSRNDHWPDGVYIDPPLTYDRYECVCGRTNHVLRELWHQKFGGFHQCGNCGRHVYQDGNVYDPPA